MLNTMGVLKWACEGNKVVTNRKIMLIQKESSLVMKRTNRKYIFIFHGNERMTKSQWEASPHAFESFPQDSKGLSKEPRGCEMRNDKEEVKECGLKKTVLAQLLSSVKMCALFLLDTSHKLINGILTPPCGVCSMSMHLLHVWLWFWFCYWLDVNINLTLVFSVILLP